MPTPDPRSDLFAHRLVFAGPNRLAFECCQLPLPGPGEVILRARHSLITPGSELPLLAGGHSPDSPWAALGYYPVQPGFGQTAEIAKLAPRTAGWIVGQIVACPLGHCSAGLIRADRLVAVPTDLPAEAGKLVTLATGALRALRIGGVGPRTTVLVVGLGLVGQLIGRLANAIGARAVAGLEPRSERRALAAAAGLVACSPVDGDPATAVRRALDGLADVVFEASGQALAVPFALRLVANGGTYVQVGCPTEPSSVDFFAAVVANGVTIRGSPFWDIPTHGSGRGLTRASEVPEVFGKDTALIEPARESERGAATDQWEPDRAAVRPRRQADAESFFDLVRAGRMSLDGLIGGSYPWREAKAAYELLARSPAIPLGLTLDWRAE